MPKFSTYPVVTTLSDADRLMIWQASSNAEKLISPTTVTLQVSSIAALKAVVVSSALNLKKVLVGGYYTDGDGGGGQFYYNSTSVLTANDGTVVAPTAGSGRWIRLNDGPINVKWFGAKGDGATNDRASIQAAIDALENGEVDYRSNNIAVLEFAPGVYNIASGLEVNGNNITFNGNKARLVATAIFSSMLKVGDAVETAGVSTENFEINGLTLDADNKANYCVHITEGLRHHYRQVIAIDAVVGSWFIDGSGDGGTVGNYGLTWYECYGGGSAYGWYFNKGGNTGAYTQFTLVNCDVEGASVGIKCTGDFVITLIGGVYENCTASCINLDATKMSAFGTFLENGNSVNDLVLTNSAIFQPSGGTNFSPKSVSANSLIEQQVIGRLEVINSATNSPSGEVLVGHKSDGLDKMTRLGKSRQLNFGDTMLARNLTDVSGADTYATLATGSYAGIEFRYYSATQRDVWVYASQSSSVGGTAFTPTPVAVFTGVGTEGGRFGVGTTAPQQPIEVAHTSIAPIVQTRYNVDADTNTFNDLIIGEIRLTAGLNDELYAYRPGIVAKGDASSSFGRSIGLILRTSDFAQRDAVVIKGNGNTSIYGTLATQNGAVSTPASAAATGTAGTILWDASYIYVCVAANTWKRVAIATW